MTRGRLAPTPTGYLHVGHARTFALAAARAASGTLIYRTEDLDAGRCRPEFADAAIEAFGGLDIWVNNAGGSTVRSPLARRGSSRTGARSRT